MSTHTKSKSTDQEQKKSLPEETGFTKEPSVREPLPETLSEEFSASQPQNTTHNKSSLPEQGSHIHLNSQYATICLYALFVITIGTFIIYLIVNMADTKASLQKLFSALSPFLIALFIAFLLNPIVKFFEQKIFYKLMKGNLPGLRKFLSIFFSYLFAIGIVTIGILYVIPQIGKSAADLAPVISSVSAKAIAFLENIEDTYPDLDVSWIEEKIQNFIPNLITYGTNLLKNLVPVVYSVSVSIVKSVVNLLLSIVVSCYMLTDKNLLAKNCRRIAYAFLPEKKVNGTIETLKECFSIFSRFITGKTLDSLIIGVLCFLIMSIFKMPYALLLSVIVGVTNMIPYFGPFIGAVPGVLIYLFLSPLQAIGFTVMIIVLQQFDGLFLGPKILGESTGLKPLWVIFAITLGGAYGGILGMFLGVPVVAVFAYLFQRIIQSRLAKKNLDL